MPRFRSIPDRKFVFHRSNAQRANHHCGQGIGELALEHGTFAGHHTVMFGNLIRKKRRKDVRQMYLLRALEISFRELEVLTHYAEINAFSTKNMSNLAQHFVDPDVGSHVARPVVSGKEQLQFFPGLPGLVPTQHPARLGALNIATDPRFQNKVHHAAVPPAAAGQGWYLYSKLFSRLNFNSGKLYCENLTGLRFNSEVTRLLSNTFFQTR